MAPARTTGNSFEETSAAYLRCLRTSSFPAGPHQYVPAMADSGGDIVFEHVARSRQGSCRAPGETGEAGQGDEEGQGKLLIASSSTPGSTG